MSVSIISMIVSFRIVFTKMILIITAVALALCKSDPVLNDGHSSNASKDDVIDGVRKKFIEKLVTQHEDEEDHSSD
jgi:hypothetical protein